MKRETVAYPSLKDERYFDRFSRHLFIVFKSHECNEVLDPTYTPEMFSVFNANLLTDMGKSTVRKHLNTTDAQSVW